MSDIKFNCPQCGTHLAVDAAGAGTTVTCPNCSQAIIVPSVAPEPAEKPRVAPAGPPGKPASPTTKWWPLAAGAGAMLILGLVGGLLVSQWKRDTIKPAETATKAKTSAGQLPKRAAAASPPQDMSPGQLWTNSLGMVFAPMHGTKVLVCIWETRVQDFGAFVSTTGYPVGHKMYGHQKDGWKEREGYDWRNPGFAQGPDHPVVGVNWEEAQAFCEWLTKKEQAEGRLDRKRQYRLPSDAEWSRAAGESKYPWGDTWPPPAGAGNYASEETQDGNLPRRVPILAGYRDGYARTSPVGSFSPNRYGLYDLGGNAWEWCLDWYRKEMNDASVLETFPDLNADGGGQTYRIYRGGGWNDFHPKVLLSLNRMGDGFAAPAKRYDNTGFRVVLGDVVLPAAEAQAMQMVAAATKENPWTNSLGMMFVPVPGTKVLFCIWETRVHDFEAFVKATGYDATKAVWSLRSDGWKVHGDTWKSPAFEQGPTHAVCGVNWEDAHAFCRWLSEKEHQQYRLPTDEEWSRAVGLDSESGASPKERDRQVKDVYPWGHEWPPPNGAGNYAGEESRNADTPSWWWVISGYRDGFARTAPVGSFKPNQYGLFDLGGNVWEWCEDFYDGQSGPRVLRGASWNRADNDTWYNPGDRAALWSSYRFPYAPNNRVDDVGFRVVLAFGKSSPPRAELVPSELPAPAVAPFNAEQGKAFQRNWAKHLGVPAETTNSIGMKLLLIPPGEFNMGETPEEIDAVLKQAKAQSIPKEILDGIPASAPLHKVRITRAFFLSAHEVTVEQFERFVSAANYRTEAEQDGKGGLIYDPAARKWKMEPGLTRKNPGFPQTEKHPVVLVSWNDASAFCRWLSRQENQTFRLPTEAEWEYACRGGTISRWSFGDDENDLKLFGNVADARLARVFPGALVAPWDDGFAYTALVGQFRPNAFGLYDMHGNAYEWCQDRYDAKYYEQSAAEDPSGPVNGANRVLRSGGWCLTGFDSRSGAHDGYDEPAARSQYTGFRVVRECANRTLASEEGHRLFDSER